MTDVRWCDRLGTTRHYGPALGFFFALHDVEMQSVVNRLIPSPETDFKWEGRHRI